MTRKLLMIPGPSEADPEVLPVLAKQVVAHYGDDFYKTYLDISNKLQQVFKTKNDTILLPAPGSAALEMAASNLIESNDKIAVLINGWFGELSQFLIESYGGQAVPIKFDFGSVVDLEKVKQTFSNNDIKAIFIIHNDTSTGAYTNIKEISKIAKQFNSLVVVDAVSSFGGINIEVDNWNIDFCVGYASKALGGVPGVTPVAISKDFWDAALNRKKPAPGRMLNLACWDDAIKNWAYWGHPYPTTQSASLILALDKALDIVLKEGLDARYKRHQIVSESLRECCKVMGVPPFAHESTASPTVTVLKGFTKDTDLKIRTMLEQKYNIMISKGLGHLFGEVVRIGHMGTSASYGHMSQTIMALGNCLLELGISDKEAVKEGTHVGLNILSKL